jgi:hypothetical protein
MKERRDEQVELPGFGYFWFERDRLKYKAKRAF